MNAQGGVLGGSKLELVTFDNKANPKDALVALKQAIDQGIRFVTQGNSSASDCARCRMRLQSTTRGTS